VYRIAKEFGMPLSEVREMNWEDFDLILYCMEAEAKQKKIDSKIQANKPNNN